MDLDIENISSVLFTDFPLEISADFNHEVIIACSFLVPFIMPFN